MLKTDIKHVYYTQSYFTSFNFTVVSKREYLMATRKNKYVFVEIIDDSGSLYEVMLDYKAWGEMPRAERLRQLESRIKKGRALRSYQFQYVFKEMPVKK